jgi:tetratricopeptide (TPR) repeat protein
VDIAALEKQIRLLYDAGNKDRTEKMCMDLLREDSTNYTALSYLTLIMKIKGNHANGRNFLDLLLAHYPEDFYSWYMYGQYLRDFDKQQDKALEAYQKSIALNPQYASNYNSVCDIYHDRSNYNTAIEWANKALEIDPQNVRAFVNKGFAYLNQNMLDDTMSCVREGLAIDPESADLHYLESLVAERQNRRGSALQRIRAALHLNPKSTLFQEQYKSKLFQSYRLWRWSDFIEDKLVFPGIFMWATSILGVLIPLLSTNEKIVSGYWMWLRITICGTLTAIFLCIQFANVVRLRVYRQHNFPAITKQRELADWILGAWIVPFFIYAIAAALLHPDMPIYAVLPLCAGLFLASGIMYVILGDTLETYHKSKELNASQRFRKTLWTTFTHIAGWGLGLWLVFIIGRLLWKIAIDLLGGVF